MHKAGQYRHVSNLSNQPLSPLDGRYQPAVAELGQFLSEAGLNRARLLVEIEWLIFLANRNLLGTDSPIDGVQREKLKEQISIG